MKNKLGKAFLLILTCTLITGCGKVKSAKGLYQAAKSAHGDCVVVSQSEGSNLTEVVLKDSLQGFEYQMYSSMSDIGIDGTHLGSVPGMRDTFNIDLNDYAVENNKDELNRICNQYGIVYEKKSSEVLVELLIGPEIGMPQVKKLTEEVADLFQQVNLNHRMDGFQIVVSHNEEWLMEQYEILKKQENPIYTDYIYSAAGATEICHMGSVQLPDISFRDLEREAEDDFLELAQEMNREAKFLRKEKKTFGDVGVPLSRVDNNVIYYSLKTAVEKESDPVMFYYFQVKGKNFVICDFVDNETGRFYTNYEK